MSDEFKEVGFASLSKNGRGVNVRIDGQIYNISKDKLIDVIEGNIPSCAVKVYSKKE